MAKKITPEQLAASGTEDGTQLALMCWCADNLIKYPELKWLHHSPNGGFRDKREAAKFKAMGVKRGFPDLFFPVRRGIFPGLLIEMKKLKGGVVSDEQDKWKQHLQSQGYGVMICEGWEAARDTLVKYLEWRG